MMEVREIVKSEWNSEQTSTLLKGKFVIIMPLVWADGPNAERVCMLKQ